jgi:hypothetical protein
MLILTMFLFSGCARCGYTITYAEKQSEQELREQVMKQVPPEFNQTFVDIAIERRLEQNIEGCQWGIHSLSGAFRGESYASANPIACGKEINICEKSITCDCEVLKEKGQIKGKV